MMSQKRSTELVRENLITHQFAGGTIGNTMHNYSVLADDRSVLLGVMLQQYRDWQLCVPLFMQYLQPYRPELPARR